MNRDWSRRGAFGAKAERDRTLALALKHELRTAGLPERDGCVEAETLGAWVDGGLDAAQMASVELHVATCARCQAVVGATARSAPIAAEAPGIFSLWKWWLAPIAAGAAAVTLWMVVPREAMQAPTAPVPAVTNEVNAPTQPQARANEAKQAAPPAADADKSLRDASRERGTAAAPAREDRQERNAVLGRKRENAVADQVAAGAVAVPPPAALPAPAAPAALAESILLKRFEASAPVEVSSPDQRRRWRAIAGRIERSEDAGASWIAVPAMVEPITGGTAPSGSTCWLIGANGLVLVSSDGITFARVPIPERVDLTAITATDARTATVTAADGRRFSTADAGLTWRRN